MQATFNPMTIADFCAAFDRKEITINHTYQRNLGVWPAPARSFLIETVLLGYPMPKLFLRQATDVRSRKTHKEVVDGQQRTMAIIDYYHDKFAVARKGEPREAAGKKFSGLDEDLQARFISYSLPIDLFVNTADDEVVEVFRRMNSYTVPLNPEERRHARWQGDFKWFIYRLSHAWSKSLGDMGVFTEKQLIRMQDAKLFTEIAHAMEHGITTTNATSLNRIYEEHDEGFKEVDHYESQIGHSLDELLELKSLHGGPLMKPYQVYALLLALIHTKNKLAPLETVCSTAGKRRQVSSAALANLSGLASALEDEKPPKKLVAFVKASAEKTNVAENRRIRFEAYCRALVERT